mmetsp:Transcript_5486/g.18558  ORF Transcript_5486/g.18558 Transcript_5486/m.18558 type:complete len:481 (-) Transcript_5486:1762-3204(-)
MYPYTLTPLPCGLPASASKKVLEGGHDEVALLHALDAAHGRVGGRQRRHDGHLAPQRHAAELLAVLEVTGVPEVRRDQHHVNVPVLQVVPNVGAALVQLEHHLSVHPGLLERLGGPLGGVDLEPEGGELLGDGLNALLAVVVHRDEHAALGGHREGPGGGQLRLGVGGGEGHVDAHDLAGGAHLGPEEGVRARELIEGQHRLLDGYVLGDGLLGEADLLQGLPAHQERGVRRHGVPDRLGDEGHGARRARVGLDDVGLPIVHRPLDVDQPDHVEPFGEFDRVLTDLSERLGGDGLGGDAAGTVARVDARQLDVLHDPPDHHVAMHVRERVHVQLGGAPEVLVDEHGLRGVHLDRRGNVPLDLALVVHDLHRAPTEHVRGPHHDRVPEIPGDPNGLLPRARDPTRGLLDVQLAQKRLEALAVLRQVDRVGRRAPDLDHALAARRRDLLGLQVVIDGVGQLEGGLPPELHDDAVGALNVDHV